MEDNDASEVTSLFLAGSDDDSVDNVEGGEPFGGTIGKSWANSKHILTMCTLIWTVAPIDNSKALPKANSKRARDTDDIGDEDELVDDRSSKRARRDNSQHPVEGEFTYYRLFIPVVTNTTGFSGS